MMEPVIRVQGQHANAAQGKVSYDVKKSLWNLTIIVAAAILAPVYYSPQALIFALIFTYLSLLIGHSAGMHRMMIHRAFKCTSLTERTLIYIGTLVGLSGPLSIIKIHDLRDWAQRQQQCHKFFSHEANYWQDIWWQLTSKFDFEQPPKITIESKYINDRFYLHLEKYWQAHQLILAIIIYLVAGWEFVVWGTLVRVAISVIGHWTITYFCHNPGPGKWQVKEVAVQASNIPGLGVLTHGECWHNNHHAFPESARIGLEPKQTDPTWKFIQLLNIWGLAYDIQLPRAEKQREDLIELER